MEIRPRLQTLGNFGLRRKIDYAETVIQMGLRRRVVVRTDDSRGALSWQLVHKVLPGTLNGPVQLTGDEGIDAPDGVMSRADYFWEFFRARKGGAVQSFLVTDLLDGKRRSYLVQFADSSMSYEMFMTRLFSADGIQLVQVDEPDVPTLDDGSVGEATDNPDQI
jgi:hypothetical protein